MCNYKHKSNKKCTIFREEDGVGGKKILWKQCCSTVVSFAFV